jgi:hypothetical protein
MMEQYELKYGEKFTGSARAVMPTPQNLPNMPRIKQIPLHKDLRWARLLSVFLFKI